MLCDACKEKPVAKGIKEIQCWNCGEQHALVNCAWGAHICNNCSDRLGKCVYCGEQVVKIQDGDVFMISANEAKERVQKSVNEEVAKIDKAIRKLSLEGKSELTLSTGLTKEYKEKQDKLFPDFTGRLREDTIKILRDLRYEISTDSSYQGSSITIKW